MAKTLSNTVTKVPRMALIVHSDMGVLSSLQSALSKNGFTAIIARDLPTALLAITQHYFEVAIVSAQLREGGDGWPLAGVLHGLSASFRFGSCPVRRRRSDVAGRD